MRPIAPRLGPNAEEIAVAEEQPEYSPLTMARADVEGGGFEMWGRWTLTPEERAIVAAGGDIYVSFPGGTPPHSLGMRPAWASPILLERNGPVLTDGLVVALDLLEKRTRTHPRIGTSLEEDWILKEWREAKGK